MKPSVLLGLTLLLLGSVPKIASAQPMTCYRDSANSTISCPGFGDFNYRQQSSGGGNSYQNRADVYDAVDELYQEVLGRDADRAGLRTYRRFIEQGWSLSRVRSALASSPEAEQIINSIYRQYLGRDADPGGMDTYRGFLDRGWSMDQVRRAVAESPEAKSR